MLHPLQTVDARKITLRIRVGTDSWHCLFICSHLPDPGLWTAGDIKWWAVGTWGTELPVLPLCPCLPVFCKWLLFLSLLWFAPSSPQSLTALYAGNTMDKWKIIGPYLHMDLNRDVNRELKSPSFVELLFHQSASEADIRSHLNISLWKMSSCVDFKNQFDFWLKCGVQSTYYLTQSWYKLQCVGRDFVYIFSKRLIHRHSAILVFKMLRKLNSFPA